jgi:hypothetical protein
LDWQVTEMRTNDIKAELRNHCVSTDIYSGDKAVG